MEEIDWNRVEQKRKEQNKIARIEKKRKVE